MLPRGTAKHDAKAIAALLDRVGAQVSFSVDAGSIEFAARCLKKDVPAVISLLAEQLREPSFPSDEFEKLRTQKLAEAEQWREDTEVQAAIAFGRAVFPPRHPFHRLTSDEAVAALKKVTVAEVQAMHAAWFGPRHCTLVAVGDVDVSQIQAEVGKAFAGWSGGRPLPTVAAAKPPDRAADVAVVVPGKESVSVILGQPSGLRYTDADHLPLAVATAVLGHGFTSRLVGSVRDTEGLTYGIVAMLSGGGPMDRAWAIHATFAPSLLAKGLASTRRELAAWHRDGITAAELDYRKSAMAGAHQVRLATSAGLAATILETVARGLDPSWIDDYPAQIAALSLDQVNAALRRRLDPSRMVIVTSGTLLSK
jgi:zinc protease